MRLFFPQWQGAGESDAILLGARRVRAALPGRNFAEVPGFTDEPAPRENGIQNRRALLANLRACDGFLARMGPERAFTLGGDCSVEVAPIAHLVSLYGDDLVVLWLDAHADVNTPQSSPSGTLHGMPVRLLLGQGDPELLALLRARLWPEQLVYAGVREVDPAEAAYLTGLPITHLSVSDLESGAASLLARVRRETGRKLYVHVDVDVVDPGELAGVACPTASGLSLASLFGLVGRLAAGCDVVGASLVEFVGSAPAEVARMAELFGALSH